MTIEDAVHFSVTYHRSYKVISVRATVPDSQAERYVLVQCGAPAPRLEGDLVGAQIVSVPISSLYSASTTHLPLLVDLQRLDVLTGVSQMKYLTGDEILKRAASGQVREFAPISTIDAELVVSQRPGVLMTGGATSASLAVIRSAGVPVVANHEWLEPTALARAEWLKYMALFLNEERAAQQLYSEMKARYTGLSARAMAVPEDRRPTIMTGRGTRGDFVIAGGRSYVAALIKDAGGRYVWADNTAEGSATIDLEAQIRRAGNADIWINGGGWPSLAPMVKDEPRYGEFKAYRTGQVWVYERRVTPTGGERLLVSGGLASGPAARRSRQDLPSESCAAARVPVVPPSACPLIPGIMTVHATSARAVESSSPVERQATYGTREALVLCGLAAGLVIAFLLSLALGSTHVPIGRVVEVLYSGHID